MAGGTDSRRSMAAYSLASHVGEKNATDKRLERYHEHVGRARRDRAIWPGAAFIVEALLLLVFLAGSLAVLMSIDANAEHLGDKSTDLVEALVMSSNAAEEFAADPAAFQEAYNADPTADRWLSRPIGDLTNGEEALFLTSEFSHEKTAAGTMYSVTFQVRKVRVITDREQITLEGYMTNRPDGVVFEAWDAEPVYVLETQRYVPNDAMREVA